MLEPSATLLLKLRLDAWFDFLLVNIVNEVTEEFNWFADEEEVVDDLFKLLFIFSTDDAFLAVTDPVW